MSMAISGPEGRHVTVHTTEGPEGKKQMTAGGSSERKGAGEARL